MLVNHEHRLLTKAAQSTNGCISVKRELDRAWPNDHSRLCSLESRGDLVWLGEHAGPHIGGTFATWQITDAGLARLQQLLCVEADLGPAVPLPDLIPSSRGGRLSHRRL